MTLAAIAWLAITTLAVIVAVGFVCYHAGTRVAPPVSVAKADCVECIHESELAPLRAAQAAAREHHAATGHLCLVVAP